MSKTSTRAKLTTKGSLIYRYVSIDDDEKHALLLEKALSNKTLNLKVAHIVGPKSGSSSSESDSHIFDQSKIELDDVGYVEYTSVSSNIKMSIKIPLTDPLFTSGQMTHIISLEKRFVPIVRFFEEKTMYV